MRSCGPLLVGFLLTFIATGQVLEKKTYYLTPDSLLKERITLDPNDLQLHGPYTKYHQNGKLAIDGYYKDNEPDSSWSFYYESGTLKSKGSYKKGRVTGQWKSYFENGNLKQEGIFLASLQEGDWTYYYENGKIKLSAQYTSGQEIGNWTHYYEVGPIKAITKYDENNRGAHTSYYYSGEVSASGFKQNQRSTGNWTYFYQEGSIKAQGTYLDGKKTSEWKEFFPNGTLSAVGTYHNGQKTGNWTYYHENGTIKTRGIMKNDLQDGDWTLYNSQGRLASSSSLSEGSGTVTSYHANGQIASTGTMKNGWMDSTWNYYDPAGNKIAEATYEENRGNYTGLYPNGNIRMTGSMYGSKKVGEWVLYDTAGVQTGTFHPYYNQKTLAKGNQRSEPVSDVETTSFDATKSDYRYEKRVNRYFDEVVNEFDAWIISSNPLLFVFERLPISLEYYQQERLGYELIYEHLRSPFTFNQEAIDLRTVYYTGHAINLRQKFYSKAKRSGMLYFGHHVTGESLQYGVKTQEDTGFRNIIESSASENRFIYGWMIGWKYMRDAGEPGLSIDGYVGLGVGVRAWQLTAINDPEAEELFSTVETEPLIVPLNFGLNIGWAFEKASKKRRKRR